MQLGDFSTAYEAHFQIRVPFKELARGVYPFGCKAYLHIPKSLRAHTHGVPKAVLCAHLGFSKKKRGYVVLVVSTGKVIDGVWDIFVVPSVFPFAKLRDRRAAARGDGAAELNLPAPTGQGGDAHQYESDVQLWADQQDKVHTAPIPALTSSIAQPASENAESKSGDGGGSDAVGTPPVHTPAMGPAPTLETPSAGREEAIHDAEGVQQITDQVNDIQRQTAAQRAAAQRNILPAMPSLEPIPEENKHEQYAPANTSDGSDAVTAPRRSSRVRAPSTERLISIANSRPSPPSPPKGNMAKEESKHEKHNRAKTESGNRRSAAEAGTQEERAEEIHLLIERLANHVEDALTECCEDDGTKEYQHANAITPSRNQAEAEVRSREAVNRATAVKQLKTEDRKHNAYISQAYLAAHLASKQFEGTAKHASTASAPKTRHQMLQQTDAALWIEAEKAHMAKIGPKEMKVYVRTATSELRKGQRIMSGR